MEYFIILFRPKDWKGWFVSGMSVRVFADRTEALGVARDLAERNKACEYSVNTVLIDD